MKAQNNIIIVQARQTSQRLPNKTIKKIGKFSICEIINKRLSKSKLSSKVIFAIPKNKKNEKLKKHLIKIKAEVFSGSEENVLKRYFFAAKKFKANNIIRVTADCPLIEGKLIDEMIKIFNKGKFDYINNAKPPYFSDGFDIEVFNFKSLKIAYNNVLSKAEKEHVTLHFKKNPKFKKKIFNQLNNYNAKLSIDDTNDLKNIKRIFNFYKPNIYFSVKSIFKKNLHNKLLKKNLSVEDQLKTKTFQGQKMWIKANNFIPSGGMLLSKNPLRYLPDYWPTYFHQAKGCMITDLDKNKFIDFSLMGIGTNVLGYANSKIDNAVKKIISRSNMSTLNCTEEVILAEKLVELHPWSKKVKFARTGGEANAIAVRIARAASKKDNIAFCGYHGWHDWYLSTNLNGKSKTKNLDAHLIKGLKIEGVPKNLKETAFPFNYGDLTQLKKLILNKNIGTIKMEVCRNTAPDKKFLKEVRKICNKKKIILIFDECTTGFRQTLGGLHKEVGIEPDMAIFGKALGNGYAITAIIGKEEIMDYAQDTFISSTFWTERIGPTAAIATIDFMKKNQSWRIVKKIGEKIQKKWMQIASNNKVKININGIPSLTNFTFSNINHQKYKTLITQEMLLKNILATTAVYPCINHSDKIINTYSEILNDIFKIIKKCEDGHDINKFLKSKDSMKEFKRIN